MRILVLQGSPNRSGSTAMLCSEFERGAREAGHEVERIDVAFADIAPCTGCIACGYDGQCALSDGMDEVREKLLAADLVVFATPLYYFSLSAQLKTVIDRFCSSTGDLRRAGKKAVLISAAWNDHDWTFDSLGLFYSTLIRYLKMEDCGRILGGGCGSTAMTAANPAMREAYELGRSL